MKYPLKLSLKTEIVPWLLLIIAFAFAVYFYGHIPSRVATHWNYAGQVDGYGSRFVGSYLIPLILLGMYALFLVIPMLDPRRDRYESFSKAYFVFRDLIILVLLAIFIATGYANMGYNVKIGTITPIMIGLLFIVLGNFLGKVKNNWFMGIRTPWTLSSENVWNKTHRLGGWLFMVFGLLMILTPFVSQTIGMAFLIVGVIALVLGTTIYSYILYQKEKRNLPQ